MEYLLDAYDGITEHGIFEVHDIILIGYVLHTVWRSRLTPTKGAKVQRTYARTRR